MISKKLVLRVAFLLVVLTATSILISCDKDEKTAETKDKIDKKIKTDSNVSAQNNSNSGDNTPGKEIFYMKSNQNNIACADCHSDGTNNNNPLTRYFSNIQGANKRTSTYFGKIYRVKRSLKMPEEVLYAGKNIEDENSYDRRTDNGSERILWSCSGSKFSDRDEI